MTRVPEQLYEDVTFLALHLHWALDEILDLAHPVRDRFKADVVRMTRSA